MEFYFGNINFLILIHLIFLKKDYALISMFSIEAVKISTQKI